MAINFSQVKAISIPEGDVKQVSLNGTVLWKKQTGGCTITYRKSLYNSTAPASIVVPVGYALTSADLPTQSDSNSWSVTGWTLDGTNAVSVGTIVSSDITLLAIHSKTVTSSNLFKKDVDNKTNDWGYSGTLSSSTSQTFGDMRSSSTTMTMSISKSKSQSYSSGDSYIHTGVGIWGGNVTNFETEHSSKLVWTPSNSSLTFTLTRLGSNQSNYTGTYPGITVRNVDDNSYIYAHKQNNRNEISYNIPEPHTNSTVRTYIQYGGNNGTENLSWCGGTSKSGSSNASITCSMSTTTETIKLYTLPVS